MKVAEVLSFDQYWTDPRFQRKKPDLRASRKLAFGDNIYHRIPGGWAQLDSHHSFPNGLPNPLNISSDTQTDRVLIATQYAYWGGEGPLIHQTFRDYWGEDICKVGQGHKRNFSAEFVVEFINWVLSLDAQGYLGRPKDWS
jgi:hypothetical protein